jgi:hypothetical protein
MKDINHYEAAKLADDSYTPHIKDKVNHNYLEAHNLGWKYITSSDELGMSKEGYFGVAFQKGDQIIVAHRGTGWAS